jgi:hypothetical protein
MAQKTQHFSMRIEEGTRLALMEIARLSDRTASATVAQLVLKEAKRLGVKVGGKIANKDENNG